MGLLRNMKGKFGRRKVQTQEVEYVPSEEDTSLKRDDVDVHDKQQRERYVKACLEQMAVASKELETLGGEYNLVTSYLTDIEEIEALPPELKTQIADMAKTLVEIESSHKQKQERKLIMSEEQYLHMERISEYMPAGYDLCWFYGIFDDTVSNSWNNLWAGCNNGISNCSSNCGDSANVSVCKAW